MPIAKLKAFLLLPALLHASGINSRCALAGELPVAAVAVLFDNDVMADNVSGLREATKQLPVEERYRIFRAHILPGKLHPEFRLLGTLTLTDLSESTTLEHLADVARIRAGIDRNQRRIRAGDSSLRFLIGSRSKERSKAG